MLDGGNILTRYSIMLTLFVTDTIKNAVGRPRPDLISRCKPKPGTPENVLVTYEVCTETDNHTLHDGWRSFPSGHSSFSFAGLGFLALYFAGQMHVFRPGTDLGKSLIAMAPLLGALMIAISRCEDYRYVWVGLVRGFTDMIQAWCVRCDLRFYHWHDYRVLLLPTILSTTTCHKLSRAISFAIGII